VAKGYEAARAGTWDPDDVPVSYKEIARMEKDYG